ncbi:Uncharacterised protein [Escherichia coli]|uniref:hypothetical protein n=1 Tax=Escherichia coli TaxID=562 RepID=UPI001A516C3B|nr:hypothetical protein [Escherichia coli]MED6536646.1 hypothetical protein [Escherichia coli O157]WGM49749.1 hypothetical protein EcMJ_507 [Escherichia phage vB_Ec-M-J]VVZ31001.1 Uncharacterised protein [Escherichia coli]VWN20960.1 Uncharacterised protein [Escherichia coli]
MSYGVRFEIRSIVINDEKQASLDDDIRELYLSCIRAKSEADALSQMIGFNFFHGYYLVRVIEVKKVTFECLAGEI